MSSVADGPCDHFATGYAASVRAFFTAFIRPFVTATDEGGMKGSECFPRCFSRCVSPFFSRRKWLAPSPSGGTAVSGCAERPAASARSSRQRGRAPDSSCGTWAGERGSIAPSDRSPRLRRDAIHRAGGLLDRLHSRLLGRSSPLLLIHSPISPTSRKMAGVIVYGGL